MLHVLFLCTGNSARSVLAEAIANQVYGERVRAVSAGSRPKRRPHPIALRTLERRGLGIDGLTSKSWEQFAGETFDLVVTLCDSAAAEPCPNFPGAPPVEHWSLPDPPASDDPESVFDAVFDVLHEAIGMLAADGDDTIAERAGGARQRIADRLKPVA